MLIAADLLLLLLDDEKGTTITSATTAIDPALGGAVLAELALAGAVDITQRGKYWKRDVVHPVGLAADAADPLLVEALAVVAARERTARDLVGRIGKGLRPQLLDRLEQAGILERHEGRVLGLFPRTTWPARDSAHETALRQRLHDALVHATPPRDRDGVVIAILSAADLAHKVIRSETTAPRRIKARAQQVAEAEWAAKAVKDAVDAANAAVLAAVAAGGAAATAGS